MAVETFRPTDCSTRVNRRDAARRLARGSVRAREITDVIETGRGCYACALGGADGRTLFVCIADGYDLEAMARDTGAIVTVQVDVPATVQNTERRNE